MNNHPHLRDVALRCNHSDSDESSTTAQQRRAFGRAANSDAHTLWLCFANASSIYRPFPGARRKVPAPFQEPSRSATQGAAARHTTGTGANVHGGQHHVHLPCEDGRSQRGHHKCAMSRCGRKMCEEQVQWKDKGCGCLAPNRENRNSITQHGMSGTTSGIQKNDTRKGGTQAVQFDEEELRCQNWRTFTTWTGSQMGCLEMIEEVSLGWRRTPGGPARKACGRWSEQPDTQFQEVQFEDEPFSSSKSASSTRMFLRCFAHGKVSCTTGVTQCLLAQRSGDIEDDIPLWTSSAPCRMEATPLCHT